MENTVDNLLYEPKNGYEKLSAAELAEMDAYCLRYRHFIDEAKTEREVVKQTVAMAQAHGFTMYSSEMKLKPGLSGQSGEGRCVCCNRRKKSF